MIEEVFENLVDQFSDPFTFYRELIQNAMDAGSNQVEVGCSYDAEAQRVLVTVSDSGEGMTERLIEEQLTKLFSSTKENDMTKIGKFGIGFVSIFSIGPELVLVDTGRAGESWRIAFDGSTRYALFRLLQPVEGTTIRLFKRLPPVGWPEFLRRSRDTVEAWCGYSDVRVSFNGEVVNREIDVDSPLRVPVTAPGTRAVVGITSDPLPEFGMYNHGLTLKQGREALLPGLTFRIKSNYLEHTLTRDNVIQDEHYHKAMKLLSDAAIEQLPQAIVDRVETLRGFLPGALPELEELMAAAGAWLSQQPAALKSLASLPLWPTHHHGLLSLKTLRSRAFLEGSFYCDDVSGPVTEALARLDVPVVWGHRLGSLLHFYGPRLETRVANTAVACPQPLGAGHAPPGWDDVQRRMTHLLRHGERRLAGVLLADFDYAGSCVSQLACLAEAKAGEPIRLFGRGIWRNLTLYPGRLLLNHRHPLVRTALSKHANHPQLCAYALAKAALLQDGLPHDLETRLLKRACT